MASTALLNNAPREKAGTEAFRAFDYQVHASMKRILEAFADGKEFSAYFDFFDDLIVVHEDGENASISFYQVKTTKALAWTAARLAQRPSKGDLPKSIIGKSYYNLHQFGELVRTAAITSNRHLKATYVDGSATQIDDGEILFSKLSKKDRDALLSAMALDFPDGLDPRHVDILAFERIPLDIASFRTTLLGLVAELLDKLDPAFAIAAKPLYDALLNEITRCTGKVPNAKTLGELRKQKSLSKADIDSVIDRVRQRTATPMEWWPTVEGELVGLGWKAIPIRRLYVAALSYWRSRGRGAGATLMFSQSITAHVARQLGNLPDSVLEALSLLRISWSGPVPSGETYTLEAGLLVELMEALT